MSPDATESTAFEPHDHQDCIVRTVAEAEAHCAREKLRLTPIRRRVLEILLEEHRAMGAYDVLSRLTAEGLGAHPPLAYRALDFLVSHGFAHRIARLNAFVACGRPGENHRPAFLICRSCNSVAEAHIPTDSSLLGDEAAAMGFKIESASIEAEGICPACSEAN